MSRGAGFALLLLAVVLGSSCAYYNSFYLARKYYDQATAGQPYAVEKASASDQPNYGRSIEFSRKVISEYPKSKWVDDAYLLWARALIGQDDPLQTVNMLEDFSTRFPNSPLLDEATFYLGVGYRQARKYHAALLALDQFLANAPRHKLAPYAYLERARALMSLQEPDSAALAAGKVITLFAKSKLADRARIARADALFAAREFELARQDYQYLGQRAATDEDRLNYLLREADCLESGRQFDVALALLKDALSHEREPVAPDTTGGRPRIVQRTPGYDHYGRLLARMGTVYLQAGRLADALASYQRVVEDYPGDPLSAEAQYRLGYAYETLGDDFDKAREQYQLVKTQAGQVGFGVQAGDRLRNLERLAQFHEAGTDSADRQVEAAFLLAEQYLFELDKPERALEEYRSIASRFSGSPAEAKALNAQAWVLSRKLGLADQADSLFWRVVHQFPATAAQLAARDYLEFEGKEVPADLIQLPEVQLAAADTMPELTPPPVETPALGTPLARVAGADSIGVAPPRGSIAPRELERPQDGSPDLVGDQPGGGTPNRLTPASRPPAGRAVSRPDTVSAPRTAPADSGLGRAPAPLPTRLALPDSAGVIDK